MSEIRCKSTFCIVDPKGIRGRMFEPPKDADGLAKLWCPSCIKIGKQLIFFSAQTAQMIRDIYHTYMNTDLPKEVKLILQQFTMELVQQLGEEL